MISLPVYHTSGFFPLTNPSKHLLHPISATLIPSSPSSNQRRRHQQQEQVYQPFRPPPSPVPSKFRALDISERLNILANRLGLWYEWAPLIPPLFKEGFTPDSIEEVTGISGVEQNSLFVAAQVRDSLVQSKTDGDLVSAFDNGGAELLYEIRLLSATQRAEAARFIVENRLDAKGARELARSMKDFPRRRGDKSWECFNYAVPGDCLSFMYYRQSREYKNPSEQRTAALQQALQVAHSEKAKSVLVQELEGSREGGEGRGGKQIEDRVKVPVVRMKLGEVAEASVVVVLPVCRAEERERGVLEAPWECRIEGEFGVVVAEKGWERWVVFPGWEPVVNLGRGVVVAFGDARVLPWKANRWYKEEAILVVADRGRKEVEHDDGFYLVTAHGGGDGGGGLKVERGSALKGKGVQESLATVVLVVRPPREEIDDQLSDEDWE